jgi:Fic family protein
MKVVRMSRLVHGQSRHPLLALTTPISTELAKSRRPEVDLRPLVLNDFDGGSGFSVSLTNVAERSLRRLANAARSLEDPDVLTRPFVRNKARVVRRSIAEMDVWREADRRAAAHRAAVTVAVIEQVRSAQPDAMARRARFDLPSIVDMHALLHECEPDLVQGGLRVESSGITMPDGRWARFVDADDVPEQLEQLIRWEQQSPRSSIEVLALGMAQFLLIHPFADGNGRTSRLLVAADLVADGHLPAALLDLDGFIDQHANRNGLALVALAHGNPCPWYEHFVDMIATCSARAITAVSAYKRGLSDAPSTERQKREDVQVRSGPQRAKENTT